MLILDELRVQALTHFPLCWININISTNIFIRQKFITVKNDISNWQRRSSKGLVRLERVVNKILYGDFAPSIKRKKLSLKKLWVDITTGIKNLHRV